MAAELLARKSEAGFSMIELLVSTAIILIISAGVTSGLLQLTNSRQTISNRTELHAGVRSATELLQQEVGQAGRVSLPGSPVTLASAVATGAQTVVVNQKINGTTAASISGVFVGEYLTIDAGANVETVAVTAINTTTKQVTATFTKAHAANATVAA